MNKSEVRLVPQKERTLYGLWSNTNDKTMGKDIPALSARYLAAANAGKGPVLPFFVLTRDYDPSDGSAKLFIGSVQPGNGLEPLTLPEGDSAVITVSPKLGFLWGPAIGEAKRYFYTEWLGESDYEAENMEYEYHTESSTGKHPTVDLVFSIREKQEANQ